jgi:hypothetical protein
MRTNSKPVGTAPERCLSLFSSMYVLPDPLMLAAIASSVVL